VNIRNLILLLALFLSPSANALPNYAVNSDGTVTNAATGLTWMRCSMGQTWTGTTCAGDATGYTWANAVALTSTFAGHNDWRLPDIRELHIIANLKHAKSINNTTVSPDTYASDFWSASSYAFNSSSAWYVDVNGDANYCSKSNSFQVHLVHGGQAFSLSATKMDTSNLSAGLISHYSFDDCTAKDGSGNGNDGILHGTQCVAGIKGKAISFNGLYDYIETPGGHNSSLIPLTVSAWINPVSLDTQRDSILPLNQYTYVSVTMDTNYEGRIYVNGILTTDVAYNGKAHQMAYCFSFGASNCLNIASRYFNGKIDEVSVYNRILSALEIKQLYQESTNQLIFVLNVSKRGRGNGTVTSNPGGINCGIDCTENYPSYPSYTNVTLRAIPNSESTFKGWGGDCIGSGSICTLSMTAAKNVTATFKANTYTLIITKLGTGNGTVTSSVAGITCGTDCMANYATGTSVTLTAAAAPGSTFTKWSGGCTGIGTCSVDMVAAKNVTANFSVFPGPELVVTDVSLNPVSPTASDLFSTNVTVKNYGTATVDGGRLTVWANQTTPQNCGATGDNSVAVGKLVAGASTTLTVMGLPAGGAGNKTLRVFVDSACSAFESNEMNNQFTKDYTVVASDFVVTAVTLTPTAPEVNGTFSAQITITNQGGAPGDGGSLQVWSHQPTAQNCGAASGNAVAVGRLAAGASTTLTIAGLAAGDAGNKMLRAFIDSACATFESNETNNQYTQTYLVSATDFVITSVALYSPSAAANGTFDAMVTVKNQGTAPGDAGQLTIWANQPTVQNCRASGDYSVAVGRLAAGASKNLIVSTLPAGNAGSKTLRAFVDSGCDFTEFNEDNNQNTKTYTSVAPDFVVTGVTLNPVSPVANSTFNATVMVKNLGTAAGNGGQLTLWTNQSVTQNCDAIGDKSIAVGTLAAGESIALIVTDLPAGNASSAGNKTLHAFVDSACTLAESNDTNNQYSQTYTTVVPDLVVTNITLTPTLPTANTTFSATVTVKNQGTVEEDGRQLTVWANQPNVQSCNAMGDKSLAIGPLAAGESKTMTVAGLSANGAGNKMLRVFIDSTCALAEFNESNNQNTQAYSVGTPDLVVTKITLNPVSPAANRPFSAQVTVKNQGTTAGSGGKLMVWANESVVQRCNALGEKSILVDTLASGESRTMTVANIPVLKGGNNTFRAFIDNTCTLAESVENNNQATQTYTVNAPDFVITDIAINPTSPLIGGTVNATVTVSNHGIAGDGGRLTVWTNQPSVKKCNAAGGQSANVGGLSAGVSTTVTIADLPVGGAVKNTLYAFVDSACGVIESNEKNNQYTTTYTIAAPDLVITDITLDPVSPTNHGDFNATVTIENQGNAVSNGSKLMVWTHQPVVRTCDTGTEDRSENVGGLMPGVSTVVTVSGLSANSVGSKTLRAFVDGACTVVESDETNNQITKAYSVR